MANTPGIRLSCPVAHFRLDRREEITVKWYILSADTIIIVIGELRLYYSYNILKCLLCIYIKKKSLGAIFQMWQESRQRQMAQFQNIAVAPEHQITGHGVNSVTPEQV